MSTQICYWAEPPGSLNNNPPFTKSGPSIGLDYPIESQVVNSSFRVTGWVKSDLGVSGTEFWIDGVHVTPTSVQWDQLNIDACSAPFEDNDPNCPFVGFEALLQFPVATPGEHLLEMVSVTDEPEFPGVSYLSRTVMLEDQDLCTGPNTLVANITSPLSTPVSGQVTFSAEVVGSAQEVDFYVDGDLRHTDYVSPRQFTWTTNNWPNGPVDLRVVAHDACGYTAEDTVTVTIDNAPLGPEIEVMGPVGEINSGDSFDFGTFPREESTVAAVFTINNIGDEDLVIANPASLISRNNRFVQSTTPDSIVVPDGSTSFVVRFRLDNIGSFGATLAINSNDSDESSFSFGLDGVVNPELSSDIEITGPDGIIANPGNYDFGTFPREDSSVARVFTISNTGDSDLTIDNHSDLVSGSDRFVQWVDPDPTIAPNESTTFVVRFRKDIEGSFTGLITVDSNDPDEDPFTIDLSGVVTPELSPDIEVIGPSGVINDEGAYAFGSFPREDTTIAASFTINNAGNSTLSITNSSNWLSGSDRFVDWVNPDPIVEPSQSTTFVVRFRKDIVGSFSGLITVESNDPDESPFTIDLSGTVTPELSPDIQIIGPSGEINNEGSYGFGSFPRDDSTVAASFLINNTGDSTLTITNPSTLVSGSNRFVEWVEPDSTIAPNQSTTFVVRFRKDIVGSFLGLITVESNDPDESPFTIDLSGSVTPELSPDIEITGPAGAIDSGGDYDFGSFPREDATIAALFTIQNTGDSELTITNPSTLVSGSNRFVEWVEPDSMIAPSQSTTFVVRFRKDIVGDFTGLISIESNDPDESPYLINLGGSVTE